MNWLLTWMFVAIVLWFLAEGFMRPDRIYQFPFLAGVMTFSFILPQLPAAANDPFLPEGAYAKTIFLGVLCLLALRLGWSSRARPLAMFEIAFSERRLVIVAALFSVIGAWFYEKLSHLPGDVSIGVQMSGMPVVYLFFARLLTYGLAIALLCAARMEPTGDDDAAPHLHRGDNRGRKQRILLGIARPALDRDRCRVHAIAHHVAENGGAVAVTRHQDLRRVALAIEPCRVGGARGAIAAEHDDDIGARRLAAHGEQRIGYGHRADIGGENDRRSNGHEQEHDAFPRRFAMQGGGRP